MAAKSDKPSPAEGIKGDSRNLRGEIAKELREDTESFGKSSQALLKFHGTYQQDDRDARKAKREAEGGGKKTKAVIFMVRSRIPGGKLTSDQLLAEIALGDELGNGTVRITTRQGLQHHGIVKGDLAATIRRINEAQLTTLGACGDINRNVLASPAPYKTKLYDSIQKLCDDLTAAYLPKTRAYHEIWITGQDGAEDTLVGGGEPEPEHEPIYGRYYLPRKFKTAVALPEDNSVDISANDLGFLAVHENGEIVGYNILVGGGMGTTPSAAKTFPFLAQPLCFAKPDEAVEIGAAVIGVQRDFGNRSDRKTARLKYTISRMGMGRFRELVAEYYGKPLAPYRDDVKIAEARDPFGWREQGDGRWFYGLYVENGRIKDEGDYRFKSALRAICSQLKPMIRLTCSQNIIFGDLSAEQKPELERILRSHGVPLSGDLRPIRLQSMACPAMPTCGLAVAESERYHPEMMDSIEAVMEEVGIGQEELNLHMTGCPNGCARPYNTDIGIVGKTLGKYTIFVGGNQLGTRLNFIYKDLVPGDEIGETLRPLFVRFAAERLPSESFGDFCDRIGPKGLGAEAEFTGAEEYAQREAARLEAEAAGVAEG